MARPVSVSEELAQLRNARLALFALTRTIEQRDKAIADALDRVVAGQQALAGQLTHLLDLFEQYVGTADQALLASDSYVVQASEVLRRLREDLQSIATADRLRRPRLPRRRGYVGHAPAPIVLVGRTLGLVEERAA